MNKEEIKKEFKINVKDIAYIAVFVALITVCSYIQVPLPVPFTLQLFAIFLAIYLLGPFKSFLTILLYLLLGLIGVPVFANFKAGISAFYSPTGGFLIGFLIVPLIYLPFYLLNNKNEIFYIISMIIGLLITYIIGSLFFIYVFKKGEISLLSALTITVFPFIIPDILKLILAYFIGKILKKANIIYR